MRVLILIAFRNLVQARRRTMFLSLALGMVTMLFVLLMAGSNGISETIILSATTLHTGHVNVAGFYKASSNDTIPIITDSDPVLDLVKEKTPGLDYVVDRHRGWSRVISPTKSISSLIAGIDIQQETRLLDVVRMAPRNEYKEGAPEVVSERADPQQLREPNTAIIFASQAKTLEVDVGDNLTLRTQLRNGTSNTIDVRIVGIARDVGLLSTFAIFVPKQTVLELYQLKPNTTGTIQIYLDDIDDADEAMRALRVELEKKGYKMLDYVPGQAFFQKFETLSGQDWVGQRLDVTLWSDEVSFMRWSLTAIDSLSLFLILILLMIIAVGIMNTMWITVRERTSEIGTLRAIGMSRLQVLAMFMFEALLLGLFATTVGASVGALLSILIDLAALPVPLDAMKTVLMSDTFQMAVQPRHVFGAIGSLTLFTIVAALWPAIRAARLQPVEAIRAL